MDNSRHFQSGARSCSLCQAVSICKDCDKCVNCKPTSLCVGKTAVEPRKFGPLQVTNSGDVKIEVLWTSPVFSDEYGIGIILPALDSVPEGDRPGLRRALANALRDAAAAVLERTT